MIQNERSDFGAGQRSLVIWAATLAIGAIAWQLSGTPFVGACIVTAVLLAVVSPEGALYGTCAAIPLVFHPIEVGSLHLGLLEIGILATLAGTLLRIAYDYSENRQGRVQLHPGFEVVWILPIALFIIGSLSLIWMPFDSHRAEALRTWRWVILEPLLLFLLARRAIAREGPAPLTTALVLPAAAVGLAAIWQLGFASTSFSVDEVQRSTATYLHPNNLALYLERAFMLALGPALLLHSRWGWLFRVCSALTLLGVATTFSRGAIIGIAVGIAVILLAHPIEHGWKLLGVGTLASAVAFALFASDRFSGSDSSGYLQTRRNLWNGAGAMVRDFPLSGIGLDQFLWLNQARYIDPRIWDERYSSHPHNLVFDSWLSLGMPGLILLLGFLCAGGWLVWKSRMGRIALSPWQLGALGCLGAGVGHGLVDNGYFLTDLSAMTWLAIALVLGSMSSRRLVRHD